MRRRLRHKAILWICLFATTAALRGQVAILSPKKDAAEGLHHIAVTIAGNPGSPAWLYVNDVLADSGTIRIDGIHDFLNVPVPYGPVEIRTEAEGAGGRIYKNTRRIHVIGPPEQIRAFPEAVSLPADGRSLQSVRIEFQDAWGYKVPWIRIAKIGLTAGSLVESDLDTASAGIQLPVEEGGLAFTLRAPDEPGAAVLDVYAEGIQLEIPVQYTTPLTPFILVGSADGSASFHEIDGEARRGPGFSLADYTNEEGRFGDVPVSGRAAFYAKGSVFGKYNVTASYDSRREMKDRIFRDLDPDEQYALYGDASRLTYDAQTQSKFYGKIERNESFLVLGDFNTGMRGTEFTAYDRSFTGLQSRLSYRGHALSGFATLNDRKMKLDEIRGEGVSGYYFLSAARITIHSDKIRIEVRDRYHPEQVLKSTEMVRYQDYDINYVDGALMFKQPVPSVDSGGNPVFIVAAYEYETDADKSAIGGIRYEGGFGGILKVGSSLIVEEKQPSDYVLYGADFAVPLGSWMSLKGELAHSESSDFTDGERSGDAWKTEIKFTPHRMVDLEGHYRRMDDTFLNASQTGSRFDQGAEKYGVSGALSLDRFGSLESEYYRQFNQMGTVNESHVRVSNTNYRYNLNEKTRFQLGYENALRKQIGADTSRARTYQSNLIRAQMTYRLGTRLSTLMEHEQNLNGENKVKPTGTSIGLSYQLNDRVELFAKQKFLTGGRNKSHTVLGFDSRLFENTSLEGQYEIGGAAGEDLNRASIGLRNLWKVRNDLTFNIALESRATIDSLEVPTPDHNAVSAAFEYLPGIPIKSTGKFELFQDKTVRKIIVTQGNLIKVWNGLSAITKLEHSDSRYLDGAGDKWVRGDYQIGLAYRPELQDAFNSVAKIQYVRDDNTHVDPQTRLDRIIVSVHGYVQPLSWLEFGGRFALRRLLDEERGLFSSRTTTLLYLLRTEIEMRRRWSLGIDTRVVQLQPIHQMKSGLGLDINYLLRRNMQVGLGYLFKSFEDPDFSSSEYSFSNFFITLRMKFSEDLFDWR